MTTVEMYTNALRGTIQLADLPAKMQALSLYLNQLILPLTGFPLRFENWFSVKTKPEKSPFANEPKDIEEWKGVTIEDGAVIEIEWAKCGLEGSVHLGWLPSSVTKFPATSNHLTDPTKDTSPWWVGPVPQFWGKPRTFSNPLSCFCHGADPIDGHRKVVGQDQYPALGEVRETAKLLPRGQSPWWRDEGRHLLILCLFSIRGMRLAHMHNAKSREHAHTCRKARAIFKLRYKNKTKTIISLVPLIWHIYPHPWRFYVSHTMRLLDGSTWKITTENEVFKCFEKRVERVFKPREASGYTEIFHGRQEPIFRKRSFYSTTGSLENS